MNYQQRPGTMFVHRNVANIVSFNDVNVAALIEYGVTHLEIPDIVVCGHYQVRRHRGDRRRSTRELHRGMASDRFGYQGQSR